MDTESENDSWMIGLVRSRIQEISLILARFIYWNSFFPKVSLLSRPSRTTPRSFEALTQYASISCPILPQHHTLVTHSTINHPPLTISALLLSLSCLSLSSSGVLTVVSSLSSS